MGDDIKNNEIKDNAVYTTGEVQELLKISESTVKRLLKKGILRANKVGGQYRILGKEILRLISPAGCFQSRFCLRQDTGLINLN